MLMEHNIPVYEKFEAMLEEHGKVILVTATGTGKSYVTLEYLERHNLRALVICPRIIACDNWKELTDRVDTVTYNTFYMHYNEYYNKYDCFIFDEAHHMMATEWSKSIRIFMQNNKAPIIGLTADSKRYCDNIDVSEALFDNCVVYGYNVTEAVENNILPPATYVCSLFDTKGIANKYLSDKNVSDKLKGRLELNLKNCYSIDAIIKKHIKNGFRKGIVFVDSINKIKFGESLIRSIFPEIKTFSIHSKMNRKEVSESLNQFKDTDFGYMVAVDMLNESLHIDGVNTIIMLRKTYSPTVFMQQVGRGLSPGSENVIIFDFVGNKTSIKTISSKSEQVISFGNSRKRKHSSKISAQSVVYDYASPIIDILEEIDRELGNRWTQEEDNIIINNYPSMGIKVKELLPNRTQEAIKFRCKKLGVYVDNVDTNIWTQEEDDILREFFPIIGIKVVDMLNNRSKKATKKRCKRLGIKKEIDINNEDLWTERELDILKSNYKRIPLSKLLELLPGRSKNAVKIKIKKLFYSDTPIKNINTAYTEEEIDILRTYYKKIKLSELEKMLPGRTSNSIKMKAHNLGLTDRVAWTKEEEKIINNFYGKISKEELMDMIPSRTWAAIVSRAIILKKTIPTNYFNETEDAILRNNYKNFTPEELAKILNRPVGSVRGRMKILDLEYNRTNKKWTPEEDKIIRENINKNQNLVFSLINYRTPGAIKARAYKLNCSTAQNKLRWTLEEDDIIRNNHHLSLDEICSMIPNRSRQSVYQRINKVIKKENFIS